MLTDVHHKTFSLEFVSKLVLEMEMVTNNRHLKNRLILVNACDFMRLPCHMVMNPLMHCQSYHLTLSFNAKMFSFHDVNISSNLENKLRVVFSATPSQTINALSKRICSQFCP